MNLIISVRDRAKYSGVSRFINMRCSEDAALLAAFLRLHCPQRFYEQLKIELGKRE